MLQRVALGFSIVLLAAVSAQPLQARVDRSAGAEQASAVLQWSRKGEPIGEPETAPPNADVFRAFWPRKKHGGASLQWTRDGQPVGPPVTPMRQVTDVELRWSPAEGVFTSAWWTRDCVRIQRIDVPDGANDVHVRLTKRRSVFTRAFWSEGNVPIPPEISVPTGANDFELVLVPSSASSGIAQHTSSTEAC